MGIDYKARYFALLKISGALFVPKIIEVHSEEDLLALEDYVQTERSRLMRADSVLKRLILSSNEQGNPTAN